MSETSGMRGNELIKRVRAYAKLHGIPFDWRPDLGKGSHGVLTLGDRRTVVRNPKDELKTGTLHGMLRTHLKTADRTFKQGAESARSGVYTNK